MVKFGFGLFFFLTFVGWFGIVRGVRSEIDGFFGVVGLSKEFVFVCGGLE